MMRERVFQAVVHRQVKNFLNRLVTLVSAAALRPITIKMRVLQQNRQRKNLTQPVDGSTKVRRFCMFLL